METAEIQNWLIFANLVITTIVTICLQVKSNNNNKKDTLDQQLIEIQRISFYDPYVEDMQFTNRWDELKEDYDDGTVFTVKITEAVPSGVVCYVKGIRAFIPASQLALEYVEDTESYVGMKIDAVIITVEPSEKRLVLSAKMIARERAVAEKSKQIGRLQENDIVEGTIERIESYGVFIEIGEGLTGLCHISQITNKFIKSPKEVLEIGQTVKAKVIKNEGGKISLSIKDLLEEQRVQEEEEIKNNIPQVESIGTSLGSLLKGLKLD